MKRIVKMDIRSAVSFTEVQLKSGNGGFICDTDFGRICVEANGSKKLMDPFRSVVVYPWAEAPATDATKEFAEEKLDWYIHVNITNSYFTDHINVIEGFTRCILRYLSNTDEDPDVVYAAVLMYIENYDNFNINISVLEEEFLEANFNRTKRFDPTIRMLVHEYISNKFLAAKKVIEQANDFLIGALPNIDPEKNDITTDDMKGRFFDSYCRDLYGIMLYISEDQERHEHYIKRNIMEFNVKIKPEKKEKYLKLSDFRRTTESKGKA